MNTQRWTELAFALLLAAATVGSAWSAYQASSWSGVQAVDFSAANAARSDAVRLSNLGAQLVAIDVGTWMQYVSAVGSGDTALAGFISQRFRPPLKVANDAWLATHPLQNPDAPPTPFAMPEYVVPELQQSQNQLTLATQETQAAKDANQVSTNYVLLTVLFASVLFFGGIGSKFESPRLRVATLVVGGLVLVGVFIRLATFPIH